MRCVGGGGGMFVASACLPAHTHQQNVLCLSAFMCLCVCETQLRMQRSLDVAFTFDSQLEAAFQGLSRRLSATTKGGSGVKRGLYRGYNIM